jgi:hypothetical protein
MLTREVEEDYYFKCKKLVGFEKHDDRPKYINVLSKAMYILNYKSYLMKNLASLVLIATISIAFAFNLEVQEPNDDRVKIDFYFESLCPYCQQYIVGSLKTAANTKV